MTVSIGPSVLDISLCIPDLRTRKKESVLQELVDCAHRTGAVREPSLLHEMLCLRERLGPTAVGKAVAVPNARSIAVFEPRLVFGRSRRGIDWKADDPTPVQLVFLVLGPGDQSLDAHHELMSRAVSFTRLQRNRNRLLEAPTLEAMTAVLREMLS
ncbi:MAG: PTS sugar transporter subunit IIA [Candidatus Eisenbacteria bacterium]|uniref:PTS sugar transporter subunit IIA n=1 Tax=Eiseniibacteriota bacterium TaxID=2212470 RepID=A0A538U1I2_UNCEI|nr:MAG: PTS sugar transporter subunit IIA [Candidatus Eisenbacteria bacterium]